MGRKIKSYDTKLTILLSRTTMMIFYYCSCFFSVLPTVSGLSPSSSSSAVISSASPLYLLTDPFSVNKDQYLLSRQQQHPAYLYCRHHRRSYRNRGLLASSYHEKSYRAHFSSAKNMIKNEDGIQLEENDDDATNPAHDTKNTPGQQEEDRMQNNSNNTSSFRLIQHMPWKRTLIGIGIYLFIGCLAYRTTFSSSSAAAVSSSSASKFSIIDGLYYTVTCLTTIGYGDLIPQTTLGKVSTALFGMTSILFWSTALGRIGAKLIDVETSVTAHLFRTHKKHRVYQYYETEIHKNNTKNNQNKNNETITTTNKQTSDATTRTVNETALFSSSSSSSSSKKKTWSALPLALIKSWSSLLASWWTSSWKGRVLVPMFKPVLVIVFGGWLIGTVEGWTWFDSIYYGFVTATTMGLGDYCPQSQLGRMVSIIVIPTLLTAAGDIFATLTRASIRHKQRRAFEQEFFHNNTNRNTKKKTTKGGGGGGGGESSEMTKHNMAAMDLNHDGKVSRAEYVLYMLMEMDIVRDDDVKELRNQFTQLDVTKSGYIEEEDFRIMEERRKNTQASLSLASSSSLSSSPSPQ